MKQKLLYGVVTLGAAVGFLASYLQMLEKITLLKNASANLACNISSVFNCSNILNAHQSSVFGFPNSLLCISFFAVTMSAGLVGWTGAQIHPKLRLIYQALGIFFIGFGFWYFWQSIFNIGSICIYCLFCYGGVLAVSGAWFRLNYRDWPVSKTAQKNLAKAVKLNLDIAVLCLIALIIVAEALVKFA